MPVKCPKCHAPIPSSQVTPGRRFLCPNCRSALRMASGDHADDRVEAGSSSGPSEQEPQPAAGDAAGPGAQHEPDEASPHRLSSGDVIGGCQIEEMLGAGAMGIVYRATQLSLRRQVAVKILPRRFSDRPRFVQRFDQESAALASLNHPNIVSIFDRGQENGTYYFVMEFVQGKTLRQINNEGPMPSARVLQVMEQTCSALSYAHRVGIVHRDIKPGNIMINEQGRVKIADFGLAFLVGQEDTQGKVYGTRGYMAPEQLRGDANVDGRADLYAASAVLYQMLVGKLPGAGSVDPSEARSDLSPLVDFMLYRGLQDDPERRHQTPIEMVADIRSLSPGKGSFLAACPECGTHNSADEHACCSCRADFAELFDACPKCRRETRRDIAACAQCGFDLNGHRKQLWAQVFQIREHAAALASQGRFEQAAQEFERLSAFPGREFLKVAVSAQVLAARMQGDKGVTLERMKDKALSLCKEHKYAEAILLLGSISKHDMDVSKEIAHANSQMQRRAAWADEGDALWREDDVAGALAAYQKASGIWPDNDALMERLDNAQKAAKLIAATKQLVAKARSLRESEQLDEALRLCSDALAGRLDSPGLSKLTEQLRLEQAKTQAAQAVRAGDEFAHARKWKAALAEWRRAAPAIVDPVAAETLQGKIAQARAALLRRLAIVAGVAVAVVAALVVVLAL